MTWMEKIEQNLPMSNHASIEMQIVSAGMEASNCNYSGYFGQLSVEKLQNANTGDVRLQCKQICTVMQILLNELRIAVQLHCNISQLHCEFHWIITALELQIFQIWSGGETRNDKVCGTEVIALYPNASQWTSDPISGSTHAVFCGHLKWHAIQMEFMKLPLRGCCNVYGKAGSFRDECSHLATNQVVEATELGTLTNSCEVVNYLFETCGTDDVISETDVEILSFTQPSSKTELNRPKPYGTNCFVAI